MKDLMRGFDAIQHELIRLKYDLNQLTHFNETSIDKTFRSIRAKLNRHSTIREGIYQLIKDSIIKNDIIQINFSFNSLLEQDNREGLIYIFAEKKRKFCL